MLHRQLLKIRGLGGYYLDQMLHCEEFAEAGEAHTSLCIGGEAGQKKFKVVVPQREHMDLIVNIRSQKKAKKLDVGLPSYIPIQHKRKPRSLVLSPATDHLCATRYSWLFL